MANRGPMLLSRLSQVNLAALCIALLLFTLLAVTHYLTSVVILLAGTVLITYLLLGPVHFVEILLLKSPLGQGKRFRLSPGARRTVAIICVYLLGLLLVAAVLFRVIPMLAGQITGLAHELPTYIERTEVPRAASGSGEKLPESFSELLSGALSGAQVTPEAPPSTARTEQKMARVTSALLVKKLVQILQEYASRIGSALLNVGASALTGLIYFLTALVMVFYLLHDGRRLKEHFVSMMPLGAEAGTAHYMEHLHLQFFTFLKGQVVISILWAGLMYLLLLLLGIKYSLLLSLFFGFATIIPVIGPWFGMIPLALVTLLGEDPIYFAEVLVFNGVFYLLKAYWLWPRLIPNKYDIHPVVFILSFLICLQVVGYLGILLSFPVASILGATSEYLRSQNPPLSEDMLAQHDRMPRAGA